jgi:peptidoglycan/xylan/chitin deacetylase (PgdA/CDA1 family)
MEYFDQTGSVFIVANRLNSAGFLQEEELEELIDNGWEVGSHSMTHTDLTLDHVLVRPEILQSRLDLENALGIKISSFAYPFGANNWYVSRKVYDYGYQSAVGVGHLSVHSFGTLYNLSRREVEGETDLTTFAELLPWSNYFVPAPKSKYTPQ